MSGKTQKTIPFDSTRCFRNCNPESYCTLEGDRVTYFAPHVPDGFVSELITPDVLFRYAEKQPSTDGEITCDIADKIRESWTTAAVDAAKDE